MEVIIDIICVYLNWQKISNSYSHLSLVFIPQKYRNYNKISDFLFKIFVILHFFVIILLFRQSCSILSPKQIIKKIGSLISASRKPTVKPNTCIASTSPAQPFSLLDTETSSPGTISKSSWSLPHKS